MRVLHVVPYFPPERIGGVGEAVANTHHELLRTGHVSEVLTTGVGEPDPRIHRVGRSPLWFWLSSIRFAREARAFDVLHVHNGEPLGLILATRWRRARPRILMTVHVSNWRIRDSLKLYEVEGTVVGRGQLQTGFHRLVKAPVKAIFDHLASKMVDDVTFISRASAQAVLGERAGSKATVIYNGLPELSDVAAGPRSHEPLLLYVGRPGVGKRVGLLPFILRDVRRQIPNAHLRIVGFERATDRPLVRAFSDLDLSDAVSFTGPLPSTQLQEHYCAAGVLVVPSVYEGLPMVVLEAMQSGLPCVAGSVGGNAEVIEDGVNGFLVQPDRPSEMAERCVRILADSELRRSMSLAGERTVAMRFSIARQVDQYLALYEELEVA